MKPETKTLKRQSEHETLLRIIATVAHSGGLADLSESDALSIIRKLSLPYWDKSLNNEQQLSLLISILDRMERGN